MAGARSRAQASASRRSEEAWAGLRAVSRHDVVVDKEKGIREGEGERRLLVGERRRNVWCHWCVSAREDKIETAGAREGCWDGPLTNTFSTAPVVS